jgi:hypothetical protein
VLVGSVLLAIVIIGLAVAFNAALHTETAPRGNGVADVADAAEIDSETRQTGAKLVRLANHGGNYTDVGSLESAIRRNLSDYRLLLSEAQAARTGARVNVSYGGAPRVGGRLVQSRTDSVVYDGRENWKVVDGATVGRFVLNVKTTSVSETVPFEVNVSNGSANATVAFRRNALTGAVNVTATADGRSEQVVCEPTSGRVLIDVLDGEAFGDTCSYDALDRLDRPYTTVTVRNGLNARAKYEVVTRDRSAIVPPACYPPSGTPCHSPAIWNATLSVAYEDAAVQYQRRSNVSVYGGGG